MAKAIHLAGGSKGTKNNNKRSAAAQKPYKSKPVATKTVKATPPRGAANNPKRGASDVNSITRPAVRVPGKGAIGAARKWLQKHGASAPTLHPFDRTSKPADQVGATKSTNSKKTSVKTPR
jgi:hypothetical protein